LGIFVLRGQRPNVDEKVSFFRKGTGNNDGGFALISELSIKNLEGILGGRVS